MNDPALDPKPWYQKDLVIFIGGSIFIALALVLISMALYTSSGASLLDLSRPGYNSVQSKVEQSDSFQAFSADGPVNESVMNQFSDLFEKQVKPVSNSTDFDSTPLQDQALGLDEPAPAQ